MSEAKTHASGQGLLDAPAAASEFSGLWSNVSKKFAHGKTRDQKKAKPTTASASTLFTDLQSPVRRGRFLGLNNADSPGDVEPSQDIVWDSTSPTHTNSGFRCTKVEISDLVNRIAPMDVKTLRPDSTLLQWIGDSAVPCTPDVPKQRTRTRSSRQSSVEDLMKLARKFDENMQQDKDTCETLNIVNNNINKRHVNLADPKLTEANVTENVQQVQHCDTEEAELHALFDSSTQKFSGRLSQGSTTSTCSQEVKREPETSSLFKPPGGEKKEQCINANKCDDFDDDWENDDLLNDSLLLAITQDPEQHSATTKTIMQYNTSQCISDCKPSGNVIHVPKVSSVHTKPSCSALQALCPKPKTTNRSTFRLGPNPVVQPTSGSLQELPASKFTALKSSHQGEQRPAVSKQTLSDSSWDDGDDALLYHVCDSVERISNSQPDSQNKPDRAVNRQQTAPVPVKPSRSTNSSASANKQSCAFVRSNSLPETSSNSLNFQGWINPMKGSSNKPQISQSLPGSHASSFLQTKHSSASSQHYNQESNQSAFKRNLSDSAVVCNKVFVTSQMAGKCSAAEIEKKKQEALARRRQRMQNNLKP